MVWFSRQFVHLFFSFVLVTSVTGFSTEQEDVSISLTNVFVPKGFDSNDQVEIIISGELPSTCYLRPRGETKIENNRVVVEMKATKIVDRNIVCIEAIIPYLISVPLGELSVGNYDIAVNVGADSEKTSSIQIDNPSSNSINNFNYANVTNVQRPSLEREIIISGIHPSSCMEIERVEVITNPISNTYSVLPIIKQAQPICDSMIKPFAFTLKLPNGRTAQELVHIRKIDGTALNFLIEEKSIPHGK